MSMEIAKYLAERTAKRIAAYARMLVKLHITTE